MDTPSMPLQMPPLRHGSDSQVTDDSSTICRIHKTKANELVIEQLNEKKLNFPYPSDCFTFAVGSVKLGRALAHVTGQAVETRSPMLTRLRTAVVHFGLAEVAVVACSVALASKLIDAIEADATVAARRRLAFVYVLVAVATHPS